MNQIIKYLGFLIPLILFGFNKNFGQNPGNIPVINTHVTSGLVMYVDAENDLSYSGNGLIWSDLSGNNNNGTISGATYDSNRKSFDFDGTNQRTGLPLPTGPYYYRISLGGTSNEIQEGWLYIFN